MGVMDHDTWRQASKFVTNLLRLLGVFNSYRIKFKVYNIHLVESECKLLF